MATSPKHQTNAWELWSRGRYDTGLGGTDGYIESFRDKGEAQKRAKSLRRSHPDVMYFVKHRKVPTRMQFGSRGHARRHLKWKHED